MKVYPASSWRNILQPHVVEVLRTDGHETYDFRHPEPGDNGFHWSAIDERWKQWTPEAFSEGLDHPEAERGFELDMRALEWCDACVLILPCGKSAHLELGYAAGAGKLTVVYMPAADEPELMYRMCDYIATDITQVRLALSIQRSLPRFGRLPKWLHDPDLAARSARLVDLPEMPQVQARNP